MKPADLSIALACAVFAGGAFAAPSPDRVTVYDATQIAHDSYVVIERIGVESWKSAFGIGGYRDEASAHGAVLAEAARLRADGVINLRCHGQTDGLFNSSGFYCYGNAIRLKNERRVGEVTRRSDEKK